MPSTAEIKGQWDQLKGQVRERWGQITDSDLTRVQGNTDQLIGMIEQKTGAARREIEQFLDTALKHGESIVTSTAETVRDYANRATEVVKDQYGRVNKQLESGLEEAQEAIRTRPGMSVGMAFGAGHRRRRFSLHPAAFRTLEVASHLRWFIHMVRSKITFETGNTLSIKASILCQSHLKANQNKSGSEWHHCVCTCIRMRNGLLQIPTVFSTGKTMPNCFQKLWSQLDC